MNENEIFILRVEDSLKTIKNMIENGDYTRNQIIGKIENYLDALEDKRTKMIRIIVAGSREFNDYQKLKPVLDKYAKEYPDAEWISGGCRGADTLAERYCHINKYPIKVFKPDWVTYKRRAGYLRNKQMADYASKVPDSVLIAFWDGKSRGTKMMIDIAKEQNLNVDIVSI